MKNPLKIAVLSDAHGVLPALQAAWQALRPSRPDRVVYAGDFTRGPYPAEVIHFLRSIDAHMIQGNDDINLLRFADGETHAASLKTKQWGLSRWTISQLSAEDIAFLQSLPAQLRLPLDEHLSLRLVHGSPNGADDSINPDRRPEQFTRIMSSLEETVLACGHSHRQWMRQHDGKLALNPGAVAGTRIGPLAQCSLVAWTGERWQVDQYSVSYDIQAVRDAFADRGLLEEGGALARAYLLSLETDFDYMMAFLRHAAARAEAAGANAAAMPDEIWEQASASFDWEHPQRTT